MHSHGVPAVIVIPVMFAIIFISRSNSRAVLWTTLVVVAIGTCFFAAQGALLDNDFGGVLALAGFIGAFGIVYLLRSTRRKTESK